VDLLVITLRLIHIVFGAVWVGMAVFTAFFMVPAIQDAGPDGGKVMAALQRRGIMIVLPVLALGTMISGIWLYLRAAAGMHAEFARTPVGMAFGLGGLLAIVAYALGIAMVRPSMLRAAALSQSAATAKPEAQQALRAEIVRLRARGARTSRLVGAMLILAAAAMAVARYL
jgi:hypothetical protein